ncbi:MAG TPA: tetratricopeptide repeat protein [Syntrophorhabdaceae bacterium]|nr:tetratricopeptide repeat protein [Syntrophorhabdaceae bacterium]
MDEKKVRDALSLLRSAHQQNSLSVHGLEILAFCYSKAKEYRKAISIYQQLSAKDPSKAKWFYYLGYQYGSLMQVDEAIKNYRKALYLYPKWMKPFPELVRLLKESGDREESIKLCRKGIQLYKELIPDLQRKYSDCYAELCLFAAQALVTIDRAGADALMQEYITLRTDDLNSLYVYGSYLLDSGRPEEAIEYYRRAQARGLTKEYVPHKMAKAWLMLGNTDQALKTYETIPLQKRTGYILNGMGKCFAKKGNSQDALLYFYRAAKSQAKWYHYRDVGLALADLGATIQAIGFLGRSNEMYRQETGDDFTKLVMKIEELRQVPNTTHINLSEFDPAVPISSCGSVVEYNPKRGYGFIRDDKDNGKLFFHVSEVKDRMEPRIGLRVKFVREHGEKGPVARKVRPGKQL